MLEFPAPKYTEINDPNVVQILDILNEEPDSFPEIVLPGSFDPLHAGHIQAKLEAEKIFQKPVTFILVRNVNKPEALFSPQERITIIREAFPDETIYTALSREEVRVSHRHARHIVRKKRDAEDTQQFAGICQQYDIDISKLVEIDVAPIASSKYKCLSIIDDKEPPSGISGLAFEMLKEKYR